MKHFKKNLRMLRDLEENDPCSNAVKQEEPLLSPSPKVEEGEHAYTYPKDEHLPAEYLLVLCLISLLFSSVTMI
jgi:hypothetical protein